MEYERMRDSMRIRRERLAKIERILEDALAHDPTHHDRWYLEQIADVLEISHDRDGVPP
jgi:hypothetical protein